jgi:hypothetical protein
MLSLLRCVKRVGGELERLTRKQSAEYEQIILEEGMDDIELIPYNILWQRAKVALESKDIVLS